MTHSVNDLLSELAKEYEHLEQHRNYLTDKLHQAVATIERERANRDKRLNDIAQALGLEAGNIDGIGLAIHRLQYDAETVECANMVLDDMKVPRVEGDMALSLVGRIKALAAGEAV